jgi:hypothetical protein
VAAWGNVGGLIQPFCATRKKTWVPKLLGVNQATRHKVRAAIDTLCTYLRENRQLSGVGRPVEDYPGWQRGVDRPLWVQAFLGIDPCFSGLVNSNPSISANILSVSRCDMQTKSADFFVFSGIGSRRFLPRSAQSSV